MGAWPLALVLWIAILVILLFGTFAEGADRAACTRAQFRLRSTGECVAKNSALGREYYRGGRGDRVIRVERPRLRRVKRPVPLPPAAPEPREDEVWPALSERLLPGAAFDDRFYFNYRGDKR